MGLEVTDKLLLLGLSSQKATETLKNEKLSNILLFIVDLANGFGPINKNIGNLLYNLGTKLPKQFHTQLSFLVEYIAKEKINQESKLTAAIKYVQDNIGKEIIISAFETSCGVGVSVSQDEIESTVTSIIGEHKQKIVEQRYHCNVGPLMGQATRLLKWADTKKVREEFDLQMLTILGPKREEDLVKVEKKKDKVKNEKPISKAPSISEVQDSFNNKNEKKLLTMTEFLKTVNFHNPGDNYKTEGYVLTADTHKILESHLTVTGGKVRTRFPPEPNGILHIGHAKAININFGYAEAKRGITYLRYDDTNPEKEEEKFFLGIKDMVEWLGYHPFKITHSSDYFDQLFEWAKKLISKDLAYICHQKPEEVRGRDPPPSPWRNRPMLESLKMFEQMRSGFFEEGEATLRLKLTLEEGKVDPVAYRIKYLPHHRTGDLWCIYPTYDYTHCLCDSIEHITHSLCTKEFQSRRSSYYWLCNSLDIYCPVQWEYGRLNMNYAVVSKRKISKLIDEGHVRDWDDPRLFTLSGLRRRGFPASSINSFCASLGLTGAQISIHPDALEAVVRDTLNQTATRVMVVLEPLKVKILNFPSEDSIKVDVDNIPGEEKAGKHSVTWDRVIYIDKSDFKQVPEKGYRRLTPNQSVGLRYCGYILTVVDVVQDSKGEIDFITVNCESVSAEKKPKGFIHWVSNPIEVEVRLYEKLFLHENPEDINIVPGGFLSDINPNSLKIVKSALADKSIDSTKEQECLQFERVGFFSLDKDSKLGSRYVFNRTVSLKEDRGKN